MAPNLAASQHELIRDMIVDGSFSYREIAGAARCSCGAIKVISTNLRLFGSTTAPPNGRGRRRSITPSILDALLQQLLEKPNQYLEEMEVFLWNEFEVRIPKPLSSPNFALSFLQNEALY